MTRRIGIAIVVAVAGAAGLSAQPARPAEPRPAIEQLLVEVRELRSELSQATNVSLRTQVLVARLQLQEGRIDSVGRQLTETRQQIATAEQAEAAMAGPVKMLDAMVEKNASAAAPTPEPSANFGGGMNLKTILEAQQKRLEELRVEESSLAALLATEQARWVEFNDRLEDVERTLAAPRPR
jgi:hypothetical protein